MSSEGSRTTSSSRLSQFGIYRSIDARTEEFLRLSRKRQIRQGCACAAVSTAITVTVVVTILLVYEYTMNLDINQHQKSRKSNWHGLFNDSSSFDAKYNKAKINIDPTTLKLLPLVLKALSHNRYLEKLIDDSYPSPKVESNKEEWEGTDNTFKKNFFPYSKLGANSNAHTEYKSPVVSYKNPFHNSEYFRKIRQSKDYRRVLNYFEKMINGNSFTAALPGNFDDKTNHKSAEKDVEISHDRLNSGQIKQITTVLKNNSKALNILAKPLSITPVNEATITLTDVLKEEPSAMPFKRIHKATSGKYMTKNTTLKSSSNCKCSKKLLQLLTKLKSDINEIIPEIILYQTNCSNVGKLILTTTKPKITEIKKSTLKTKTTTSPKKFSIPTKPSSKVLKHASLVPEAITSTILPLNKLPKKQELKKCSVPAANSNIQQSKVKKSSDHNSQLYNTKINTHSMIKTTTIKNYIEPTDRKVIEITTQPMKKEAKENNILIDILSCDKDKHTNKITTSTSEKTITPLVTEKLENFENDFYLTIFGQPFSTEATFKSSFSISKAFKGLLDKYAANNFAVRTVDQNKLPSFRKVGSLTTYDLDTEKENVMNLIDTSKNKADDKYLVTLHNKRGSLSNKIFKSVNPDIPEKDQESIIQSNIYQNNQTNVTKLNIKPKMIQKTTFLDDTDTKISRTERIFSKKKIPSIRKFGNFVTPYIEKEYLINSANTSEVKVESSILNSLRNKEPQISQHKKIIKHGSLYNENYTKVTTIKPKNEIVSSIQPHVNKLQIDPKAMAKMKFLDKAHKQISKTDKIIGENKLSSQRKFGGLVTSHLEPEKEYLINSTDTAKIDVAKVFLNSFSYKEPPVSQLEGPWFNEHHKDITTDKPEIEQKYLTQSYASQNDLINLNNLHIEPKLPKRFQNKTDNKKTKKYKKQILPIWPEIEEPVKTEKLTIVSIQHQDTMTTNQPTKTDINKLYDYQETSKVSQKKDQNKFRFPANIREQKKYNNKKAVNQKNIKTSQYHDSVSIKSHKYSTGTPLNAYSNFAEVNELISQTKNISNFTLYESLYQTEENITQSDLDYDEYKYMNDYGQERETVEMLKQSNEDKYAIKKSSEYEKDSTQYLKSMLPISRPIYLEIRRNDWKTDEQNYANMENIFDVILLIYEYAIAVESSLVQRIRNKQITNDTQDHPIADRLGRSFFGFDQDYFEKMPMLVNAMQEDGYEPTIDTTTSTKPKPKYVIANYSRQILNTVNLKRNSIRRTSPRPFYFEYKSPAPTPFTKTYGSRSWVDSYRNAQRLKNLQQVIKYLEKTINAKFGDMYALPTSTIAFSGVYVEPIVKDNNQPKPTLSTMDLIFQDSNKVETFKSNHKSDPLYIFKPDNPGDVNLLADGFFRFSPIPTPSLIRDKIIANMPMFRPITYRKRNCIGLRCMDTPTAKSKLTNSQEVSDLKVESSSYDKTKTFSVMLNLFPLKNNDFDYKSLETLETTHTPINKIYITTSQPTIQFRRRSTTPIRRTTTRVKRPRIMTTRKLLKTADYNPMEKNIEEPKMIVHVNVYPLPETKDQVTTESNVQTTIASPPRYSSPIPMLTSTQVEDYHVGSSGIIPPEARLTPMPPPPLPSIIPTLPNVSTGSPFISTTWSNTESEFRPSNLPEVIKFSHEDAKIPEQYKKLMNLESTTNKPPEINRRNSNDSMEENDDYEVEPQTLVVKLKNSVVTTTTETTERSTEENNETTTVKTYVPQINGHYRSVNQNSKNINTWLNDNIQSNRKRRLEMSVTGFRKSTYVPQYVEIKRNNTRNFSDNDKDE